jgi:hypothetical protein
MNNKVKLGNQGLIGTIVLIIVALIILGYFQISFESIIMSPVVQENLKFAWHVFVQGLVTIWGWITDFSRSVIWGA